jgi:hypothetical protein
VSGASQALSSRATTRSTGHRGGLNGHRDPTNTPRRRDGRTCGGQRFIQTPNPERK